MNATLHLGHARTATRGAVALAVDGIGAGVGILVFVAPMPVVPVLGAGSVNRLPKRSAAGH